jgi:polyphosphate kinase
MTLPRYHNREISLLEFQERVLALAESPTLPILERVKFLAIVASNLDEFFQVRVAGLRDQESAGLATTAPDGMSPADQLAIIRDRVVPLVGRMERLYSHELLPGLAEHGIEIVQWDDLADDERSALFARFEDEIYPVLTPLAVDPSHPFPYISNLSLNLAVTVRDPSDEEEQFARIKVPPLIPRFLGVPAGADNHLRVVAVEQVIAAHLDMLFPGLEVVSHHAFRVTRSAEQAIEEDEAEDLLEAMQELLQTRQRFSRAVRLEVDTTMPSEVLDLLMSEMRIQEREVYVHTTTLDLAGLAAIHGADRPELKDPPWVPTTQPALADIGAGARILDRIAQRDVLVHLPYDAFGTSIGAFIAGAARDPSVVAIKQTLYRTSLPDDPARGGEESIVRSLITAARSGKQVVVLVELKARFDEEANINWARMLEEAGVHVVYGVVGLKTHAKIALVVRREADGLKRYSHIGTGNYNPKTARLYEDLGLLTADDDIGADLSELFNVLTGYSRRSEYRRLAVAPLTLRTEIVRRIRQQAAQGPAGRITMKLNHLVDPEIIDELYGASAAGTPIDLIVRGICCLRPGRPGLSDTITVRSIVGRYLEHSRIFRFGSGDDAEYLIGSADMMPRNLNGRVEALVPIDDPALKVRLEEILQVCLADDQLAWELLPDQTWSKVSTARGLNAHVRFQELALDRARGATPDPEAAQEPAGTVLAAGGIVYRPAGRSGEEILLVHRPRYDDWSFPKGKVDAGEPELEAAVREVAEETGQQVDVGPEVGSIEYTDRYGKRKIVRYWAMRALGGEFQPNEEVDEVRWVTTEKAFGLLTYERDRALLRSSEDVER